MPRERTLSHGFFTNHLLASCSPIARLLFQGIWTVSDFDGCFAWDPPALAMKLLPRDAFNPSEAMDELERLGFIQSYEHNGGKFGFVVNWHKYQDPHPGERAVFPKPKDDQRFCVRIKAPKYRTKADLAFGQQEVGAGIIQYSQVANKLQVDGEQVVSKAFPSNLSCPSSPSLPTNELHAAPPAPLVPLEKPSRKSRKKEKLGTFHPEVVAMIARLMEVWPTLRDGKKIENDDVRAAGNAQLILDTTDATVEQLEAAAMAWLATNPTFPNAIQFWFGTSAKAPWRPEVMNLNLQKVLA